jgi:hypothetical protein
MRMRYTLRVSKCALLAPVLAICFCAAAQAQEKPVESAQLQTSDSSSGTQSTVIPPASSIDDDPHWHFTSLSYLWFPGIHGTVGAKGYSSHVDVSPADVLKHFNIGLMGSFEPQYKRWSFPIDFVWAKLSDTKNAIQFPDYSAKATVKEGIFTEKVNYLVLNGKMVKVRATAGAREWYSSQTLKLTPPTPPTFSVGSSLGWADVVGGANFLIPLSPKMSVMIAGDAGAGGANLDYQVAGIANYQIKPKWGIGIGYRYLDVNYRNNNQNILDVHQSGIALTLLYKYGKQPPAQ